MSGAGLAVAVVLGSGSVVPNWLIVLKSELKAAMSVEVIVSSMPVFVVTWIRVEILIVR